MTKRSLPHFQPEASACLNPQKDKRIPAWNSHFQKNLHKMLDKEDTYFWIPEWLLNSADIYRPPPPPQLTFQYLTKPQQKALTTDQPHTFRNLLLQASNSQLIPWINLLFTLQFDSIGFIAEVVEKPFNNPWQTQLQWKFCVSEAMIIKFFIGSWF